MSYAELAKGGASQQTPAVQIKAADNVPAQRQLTTTNTIHTPEATTTTAQTSSVTTGSGNAGRSDSTKCPDTEAAVTGDKGAGRSRPSEQTLASKTTPENGVCNNTGESEKMPAQNTGSTEAKTDLLPPAAQTHTVNVWSQRMQDTSAKLAAKSQSNSNSALTSTETKMELTAAPASETVETPAAVSEAPVETHKEKKDKTSWNISGRNAHGGNRRGGQARQGAPTLNDTYAWPAVSSAVSSTEKTKSASGETLRSQEDIDQADAEIEKAVEAAVEAGKIKESKKGKSKWISYEANIVHSTPPTTSGSRREGGSSSGEFREASGRGSGDASGRGGDSTGQTLGAGSGSGNGSGGGGEKRRKSAGASGGKPSGRGGAGASSNYKAGKQDGQQSGNISGGGAKSDTQVASSDKKPTGSSGNAQSQQQHDAERTTSQRHIKAGEAGGESIKTTMNVAGEVTKAEDEGGAAAIDGEKPAQLPLYVSTGGLDKGMGGMRPVSAPEGGWNSASDGQPRYEGRAYRNNYLKSAHDASTSTQPHQGGSYSYRGGRGNRRGGMGGRSGGYQNAMVGGMVSSGSPSGSGNSMRGNGRGGAHYNNGYRHMNNNVGTSMNMAGPMTYNPYMMTMPRGYPMMPAMDMESSKYYVQAHIRTQM